MGLRKAVPGSGSGIGPNPGSQGQIQSMDWPLATHLPDTSKILGASGIDYSYDLFFFLLLTPKSLATSCLSYACTADLFIFLNPCHRIFLSGLNNLELPLKNKPVYFQKTKRNKTTNAHG